MAENNLRSRPAGWLVLILTLALSFSTSCRNSNTTAQRVSSPSTENVSETRIPAEVVTPIVTPHQSPGLFEFAPQHGLEWKYENGEAAGVCSILESLGGGAGLLDFDRDGWLDVFFTGGGKFELPRTIGGMPNGLFRNLGQWQFSAVAQPSGIASAAYYTHGVAAADADNDGFTDVLVTGYGGVQLFHNQGDGTFYESAEIFGLHDCLWSSSAAWADLNGDGNLDLYICHYVDWSFDNHPYCAGPTPEQREISYPKDFSGLKDTLYLNNGDSTFSDASETWQLVDGGKGLGVIIGDLNADGRPDIYVANDTTDNFLYLNEGQKLVECGVSSGVARDDDGVPNGSMGVDLCDFNGDLLPDLWAANYERETFALYRNEGNNLFLHVSRPTGITALGGLFVGFGTAFTDADGDGDMDVLVANGHVIKYPKFTKRKQKPLLLINERNRFSLAKHPGNYFDEIHEGRGLTLGDLDNDARPDVVISNMNEPVACLRSTLTKKDSDGFLVQLIGRFSNRDAVGARVLIQCAEGKLTGLINGGGSYLSSRDTRMSIQIPKAWHPEHLEVRWPTGQTQGVSWTDINGQSLTLVEPLQR